LLVKKLMDAGLTPTDIHHLEYLTDRKILDRLPGGFRWLQRNRREDVVVYMETFADLLDEQLPPQALQAWLEELTALPANQVSAAAVAEVPVSA
jgi:hypothetical protein